MAGIVRRYCSEPAGVSERRVVSPAGPAPKTRSTLPVIVRM